MLSSVVMASASLRLCIQLKNVCTEQLCIFLSSYLLGLVRLSFRYVELNQ